MHLVATGPTPLRRGGWTRRTDCDLHNSIVPKALVRCQTLSLAAVEFAAFYPCRAGGQVAEDARGPADATSSRLLCMPSARLGSVR